VTKLMLIITHVSLLHPSKEIDDFDVILFHIYYVVCVQYQLLLQYKKI